MEIIESRFYSKFSSLRNFTTKNYLIICFLLLFTLIPNIYLTINGSDFDGASLLKKALFLLLSFGLLIGFLSLIRPKLFFLITSLFIILAPFELFIIHQYHCSVNPGIIVSILHTNYNEATEFLHGFLTFIILCFFFNLLYIILIIRCLPYSFKIQKKYRMWIGISFILVLLSIWLRDVQLTHSMDRSKTKHEVIILGTQHFSLKFGKIFPFNYIIQIKNLIANQLIINEYKKNVLNFKFNALKKDTIPNSETYVLVIGESSRRHNYQLYNYPRQNNPFLIKQNNLITYTNCISTGNLTFFCIPMLMSRATPLDFNISYKEKSFISAFKETGFQTFWISNLGLFNSDHARISNEADEVYDLNSTINNANNFDAYLLPFLDSALKENPRKKLIIINLMGSHFRYNNRYPTSFNKFKPGFDGAFEYSLIKPENKNQLINIYDNSILYTDFILHQIIQKIENQKSVGIVAYLSDHGENLFDDSSNIFAHGSEIPTKYEVEIPLVIWYSNLYAQTYPIKTKNLFKNKDKSTSSNNIFYSMLDAANIGYKKENLSKSFLSDLFKEDSIRMILNPNNTVFIYNNSKINVKKN